MGADLQFRRLCATSLLLASLISAAEAAPAIPADDVAAAVNPQAARMLRTFKAWAKKWKVHNTSVAIMRGKRLIGRWGIGYGPNRAMPVASESKAITAMCIATLVDAGKLKFNTPLREPLADYFTAHPPVAVRAPSITIGQLLTHSSGITYDPSQSKYGSKVQALGLRHTHLEQQSTLALSKPLGRLPGRAFAYNNMNYALLGFVIETVTQTPYEKYCFDHVLKPAGVTEAFLNPRLRIMSSWAGWKISAVNYGRFLEYFVPSLRRVKTTVGQWPKFRRPSGDSYTLGAIMHVDGSGRMFHHEGKWKSSKTSFGAYFAIFPDGIRYVANYAPLPSKAALHNMHGMMSAAATAEHSMRSDLH